MNEQEMFLRAWKSAGIHSQHWKLRYWGFLVPLAHCREKLCHSTLGWLTNCQTSTCCIMGMGPDCKNACYVEYVQRSSMIAPKFQGVSGVIWLAPNAGRMTGEASPERSRNGQRSKKCQQNYESC